MGGFAARAVMSAIPISKKYTRDKWMIDVYPWGI
jgi:hypothetical protein